MSSGRLVIVSNRLPVTASLADGKVRLSRAAGGLATGLQGWHAQSGNVWVGWPGDVSAFDADQRIALESKLAERRVTPVYLSHEEIERYYEGFANGVIWPLFHYLADRVPVDATGWEAYRDVNAKFADAVAAVCQNGDAVAGAIKQALAMPRSERRSRMQSLRRRVLEHDVDRWAERFVEELRATAATRPKSERATGAALTRVIEEMRDLPLTILLDYDGTVVPIARAPQLAAPDPALESLLIQLAARPRTALHLVSGRPRDTLEDWFGHVPVALWAEHGFWHRPAGGGEWQQAAPVPGDWLKRVYPILEQFTTGTPGSLIEEKSASIAWHYRMAEPEFGTRQAHELRMLLGDALSNQPLEVLEGKKVIEVRLRGVSKAVVSQRVLAEQDPAATVLAIGDDRTDEDLFSALPDTSVTIAVGTGRTQAKYFVDDHRAVRNLLRMLLP